MKILHENESYTFRSYFELPYEPDEILAEFGYTFSQSRLILPKSSRSLPRLDALRESLETILPLVRLTSETARRETLVAPILMEVSRLCNCQLRIEYPLNINNLLKGTLDYLLREEQTLLVVEAKKDDLTRGFTQLAVEMIALTQAYDLDVIYGAVTIGEAWRFGRLEKQSQQIIQDLTLYPIPDRLEDLLRILSGIIEG